VSGSIGGADRGGGWGFVGSGGVGWREEGEDVSD